MRKAKIILCAALVALAGCAPCYADAATGKTKIATQEWVRRTLAQSGIRVSAGNVTTNITTEGGTAVTNITTEGGVTVTNITTEGGVTVTNIVFTSPFSDTNFPGIVSISLTFSPPVLNSGAAQTPTRGARLLRAASGGPSITVTLKKGMLLDGSGGGFLFADMWEMTWTDFPEAPPDSHVCQLDSGCNCVEKDNTEAALKEAMPEEYKTLTDKEALAKWPDPSVFYPDWGTESWQLSRTLGGQTVYFVNAYDPDGVREQPIRVADIGKTDAWLDAIVTLVDKWNEQMLEWQRDYVRAHVCTAENPQHSWATKTCGSYSWSVCLNNDAHRNGSENHEYPYVGGNFTETHHSCKCGTGPIEAHGTLVPDGERTPTYNSDSKEDGWTQTWVCPSGCGYSKIVTHTHHFTNCGTCDAGDDCDTVCTGCSGNHVFGNATADECAKCECTMCDDCNAHPDETDITKHSGWMPCSQDVEGDNDDGTANGAHCQCQCLTFGHNANTAHNYQGSAGYEQIMDKNSAAFGQNYHYHILGQCTRCNQWKKQFDAHSWPQTPTEYRYVSDSVCAYLYECDKCQKKKREDDHEHALPSAPEVCLDVSASVCRKKFICTNCKGVIPVDGGHVRGDGCKCANGCGRQLDHEWSTDACGNRKCSHCGAKDESQTESHSGWTSISSSEHKCACGEKTESHGDLEIDLENKTPTYNSGGKETGWSAEGHCSKCDYTTQSYTHTHHFTNCGTCDAGDDCDTVCTGCSGNHVFGEASGGECAKCECTMCSDCNAHPPYTDESKHTGWHPCGEDDEEGNDNADGTANGGHCVCQCLAWSHNAALSGANQSRHDYVLPSGFSQYEQISDASATDYAKTHHYKLIGRCSRSGCGRWKKQREEHDWPENPTRYSKASDSVCRRYYACTKTGCGYEKHNDESGHSLTGGIIYEAVTVDGSPKCRQRQLCANCNEYIYDDTHDHTRGEDCKCANGCGYQFDHSYSTDACGNSKCQYCGAYQYSQQTHTVDGDGTDWNANGHKCACGAEYKSHSLGGWTVYSVAGYEVTYRRSCSICPYYEERTEDTNPCKNGHVGLQDACGCACGYYSSTGQVATAKSLHHWTDGGLNGNPECICDCGNSHQFKDESTYDKNRFPQNTDVVQCLGICWACKERDSEDRFVSSEDHQPIAAGDQAGAARCGCRCGKVRSTLYEKFHYRNSGGVGGLPSCRCYGQGARAPGASAGSYHFRDPSDCPKVCSVTVNGERHLAAEHDKVYAPSFVKADVKAHEAKDTGNLCGCKCGLYTTSNWTEWNGKMDFHRPNNSCCCGCPGKKHFPIARSYCTSLCGGNCTGLYADGKWGQTSGAMFNPTYHDPSDVACKCQCEYFSGASAPDKFHSLTNSSKRCYCIGLHKHKFPHPRSDCTQICSICGNGHEYAVAPSGVNEPGTHTWEGINCKCECPERKLRPSGHQFEDDKCVCQCGDVTRGHVYQQYSKTATGTHECDTCGNTITEYTIVYKCKRCGDTGYSVNTEEGHKHDCGVGDGVVDDPGYEKPHCDKHNVDYDTECPYCKEEDENGGGNGNGGGTGGGGGRYDI